MNIRYIFCIIFSIHFNDNTTSIKNQPAHKKVFSTEIHRIYIYCIKMMKRMTELAGAFLLQSRCHFFLLLIKIKYWLSGRQNGMWENSINHIPSAVWRKVKHWLKRPGNDLTNLLYMAANRKCWHGVGVCRNHQIIQPSWVTYLNIKCCILIN